MHRVLIVPTVLHLFHYALILRQYENTMLIMHHPAPRLCQSPQAVGLSDYGQDEPGGQSNIAAVDGVYHNYKVLVDTYDSE